MNLEYSTDRFVLIANYALICLPSFYMSVYIFCKSQNIKLRVSQYIYIIISGILFTTLFVLLRLNSTSFSYFLYYLIVPVLLSLLTRDSKQFFKSLIIGSVSISLVFVLDFASVFIQSTVFWLLGSVKLSVFNFFFNQLMMIIFCILFMNIKRFKRGFQFFQTDENLGLGLTLSVFVMFLKCIKLRENSESDYTFIVFIIGSITAGFGLFFWIRRSITAHQRKRMQLKSKEHYQEVLKERDKEIEKQRQSNEYLAKIVHRDNHLMNSLNTAIDAYQNTDDHAEKSDLFREIQTMIKERGELIDREQRETKLLPSTGSILIDSTINDLFIKAAAHGIDFDMAASAPVSEIIGKYISQTDLQTLLSDHIKDAVIAVEARGDGSGKILLDLSMQNDNYCITIYDNGVAFEPDTLSKLGMERVTTHAESGGSGIGFMTTFETLKKAYASLILTEFDSTMPFTKSVAFRFDGESSFIIQSHRSEELKEKLTRDDVVIL